jgi:hypothetical protein
MTQSFKKWIGEESADFEDSREEDQVVDWLNKR